MSGLVLDIKSLDVQFPGLVRNVKAVRGIDLEVEEGCVMGVVGESGCGKSITAMACLGLVPSPGLVSGSVMLDGQEIIGCPDSELVGVRGGKAAMIFQNPMKALNPFFTVGRQMTDVIRRHRNMNEPRSRESAIESLDSVHLPDPDLVLDKYPHQMSGGQIQRVMIAMALACRPKVIIADEPTTALDVTVQAQIITLLRELATEQGRTILFITHDLAVVASLCDKVAVMYAGKVVETGDVNDIFSRPGHPYTAKLMNTVPRLGHRDGTLEFIPGQVPDMASPPPGCAFHPRCVRATDICVRHQPEYSFESGQHKVACHHVNEGHS
jgi:peptide/nickel transport system ATP-binding protein